MQFFSDYMFSVNTVKISIRSFHSIHNVVDHGVLQATWEELVGKVGHRDQLIVSKPLSYLSYTTKVLITMLTVTVLELNRLLKAT